MIRMIHDYYVMIEGQNIFDRLVKNNLRTYDTIWKNVTGQGDKYATGFLLDFLYFIVEEAKETIVDFSLGTVRVYQDNIKIISI